MASQCVHIAGAATNSDDDLIVVLGGRVDPAARVGRLHALAAMAVTLFQRFDPALWACPGSSGQVNRGHPGGDQ